jgi:recombination protein RecA
MDVRKVEQLKGTGNEFIGSRTRVKIVKNKVAPPFKEAEFDIMYGKGISREGEILDLAVKLDIINKSGAWFSYNDVRLGQGRDNVKDYLASNPELLDEIEAKIKDDNKKLIDATSKGKLRKPITASANEPVPVVAVTKSKLDIIVDEDD